MHRTLPLERQGETDRQRCPERQIDKRSPESQTDKKKEAVIGIHTLSYGNQAEIKVTLYIDKKYSIPGTNNELINLLHLQKKKNICSSETPAQKNIRQIFWLTESS